MTTPKIDILQSGESLQLAALPASQSDMDNDSTETASAIYKTHNCPSVNL